MNLLSGFSQVSLIVLMLVACANTARLGDWENPNYHGLACKKFLVMGVSLDSSAHRIFEDRFVGKLKAQGVEAVPGYKYIEALDKRDLL